MPTIKRITLIGVGLIGGSLVLDLKRHKLAQHITGIDLDRDNLQRALERRVIDQADTRLAPEHINSADLIVIAAPVAALPDICRQLAPHLRPHTIVSDVGSTKLSAITAFRQHLGTHFPRCVATHPIAGSDRSGALAARFNLYRGKKLIICPHEAQDTEAVSITEHLWQAIGAHTFRLSAEEHDAVFAAVSHFPHLLAFAYMQQLLSAENANRCLNFAGSGFRDFTRIAASNAHVWKDIFLDNRRSLCALIEQQEQQLAYLKGCLKNQDTDRLLTYLQHAQQAREKWEENHYLPGIIEP